MWQSQGPSESEQSKFLGLLHKALGVYYATWKCESSITYEAIQSSNGTKNSMSDYPDHEAGRKECNNELIETSDPYLHHRSPIFTKDTSFWWEVTGAVLRTLLSRANYSMQRKNQALSFHRQIVHSLGPRPTSEGRPKTWSSFMTDDFSPLEFSWHWGDTKNVTDPTIRMSIEAIGAHAGTTVDPWNRTASLELLNQLCSELPGIDLQYFRRYLDVITSADNDDFSANCSERQEHRSSIFLAFEFVNQRPLVKAYLLPLVKAVQTSRTVSAIVCEALRNQAQDLMEVPSLYKLLDFLETTGRAYKLQPIIFAFDCVAINKSRIKVYARTPLTSYTSVRAIMGMFDVEQNIKNGLEELQQLWQLALSTKSDFDPKEPLPHKEHSTAGMLYYFEVRPGSHTIMPKVYIPVKHYGQNDEAIARGLKTFIVRRNRSQAKTAESYLQALREICTYRSLSSETGLQTYISCGLRNGSLDITSYLSPEIYHKGRSSARS